MLAKTSDLKKATEAEVAYAEVEKETPNSYLAAEAKLARARLRQVGSKEAEAAKLYEEVAKERKVELPKDKESKNTQDQSSFKDERGREYSPEELAKIRNFVDSSYANVAEKQLQALKGQEAPAAKK
jgi:hypothetical protein